MWTDCWVKKIKQIGYSDKENELQINIALNL